MQGPKYRVDEPVSDHVIGKYHRGVDLDRRLTVGLLILREELAVDPVRLAQLEQAVARVRSSPHPELRRIFGFKTIANQNVLVDEFVVAPRPFGTCSGPEARYRRRKPRSSSTGWLPVVAHASTHQLENVNLTLSGVQLCDPAQGQDPVELKVWSDKPLTEWPELAVRVAPIDFDFAGQSADLPWTGGVTLPPGKAR